MKRVVLLRTNSVAICAFVALASTYNLALNTTSAGAQPASSYLHDGDNTINPWSRNEKEITRYREALDTANAEIKRNSKAPKNFINRADAYLYLMKPREALSDANTALLLKPGAESLCDLYCNRGEALLQLHQYSEALTDLNKACTIDPEYGEAFYFRGMAKEKLGQIALAINDYAVARSLGFTGRGFNLDFAPFLESMQRRIKKAWFPPKGNENKRVVVAFQVARDGSVLRQKITKSSGVSSVDAAATTALRNAAPFPPLPKGAPENIDIEFTFDYNAFKSGAISGVNTTHPPAGVSYLDHTTNQWNQAETDARKKLEDAKKGKDEGAISTAELQLAHIYTDRGKYPLAIDLYRSAFGVLEKNPDRKSVYGEELGNLAMVYSLQGKNAEAEVEFKKALELIDSGTGFPSNPAVMQILKEYAKVLYKTNRVDEANKIYARLKK